MADKKPHEIALTLASGGGVIRVDDLMDAMRRQAGE